MNFGKLISFLLVSIFLGIQSVAQEQETLLQQLMDEDQEVIEALVLYPAPTRAVIFEACSQPEVLVRIDRIQKRTTQAFQELITAYPRTEQEAYYDLARFPGLINQLVVGGPKTRKEVEAIASQYPLEIQATAKKYGAKKFEILRQINDLQKESDAAFIDLLADYPPKIQDAYKELMEEPEIMNLLTDDIKMAILVGDLFQNDAAWLVRKTDSLHLEVARRNAEELEDWKENLEDDYQTLEEAKAAAREFARENDYEVSPYDRERIEIIYRPYPYWFGYPYWYTYPYWRPYPYWYHTGFYLDSGGSAVILGLPSFYYTFWLFNRPRTYYRWHDHFSRYHRAHPYSNSGVTLGLRSARSRVDADIMSKPREPAQRTIRSDRRSVDPKIRERTTERPTPRPAERRISAPKQPRAYDRHRANEYHRQTWNRTPRQRPTTTTGPVRRIRKKDN